MTYYVFVLDLILPYLCCNSNVFVPFYALYFYWICNVFAGVKVVGIFPISSLHSLIVRGLIGNVLQYHSKFQTIIWHSMLKVFWRKKYEGSRGKKSLRAGDWEWRPFWLFLRYSRLRKYVYLKFQGILLTKYHTKYQVTKHNYFFSVSLFFFIFISVQLCFHEGWVEVVPIKGGR